MTDLPSLDPLGGWPAVFARLTAGSDLSSELAVAAFGEILDGRATDAQIAGFAVGLRAKGETVDELAAVLSAMLVHAVVVPLSEVLRAGAVDTCGTGGDRSHSVNVSTMAAFVLAGSGVPVCKHGNRAASSSSGSADVLEALGVALEISPAAVARCVAEAGIGFCLAPRYHPALRFAAPVRRELGVATLFNFLGPLANPGRVHRQVVGVPDASMAPKLAGVLAARGSRALVVRGDDGLDELSTTTTTHIWDVADGVVREWDLDPSTLGLPVATVDDLRGGTPAQNAEVARSTLAGKPGPVRDIVVLNAAAGLIVAGHAADFHEGLVTARDAIDDGRAMAALDRLVVAAAAPDEP